MRAGFIGLGAMGRPMAENLARRGHLAGVWNRTAEKASRFADRTGVRSFPDVETLAAACEVVFTCVSADEDVLALVDRLATAIEPGTVMVDTSTTNPATARTAAGRLHERGGRFLDAPVSGGVEGARRGTLAMMVGGEAGVLEGIRPALECLASRIEHMGPAGSGQATKAVNQVMAAGINQAVSEALAFADAQRLPLDKVIDVIGSGAAGNWFLRHRGPGMARGEYAPGFRTSLHRKDLEICQSIGAELGVAMPIVEMTLIHYRRLIEAGYGDEDISALHREKLALFGNAADRPRRP